MTNTNVQRKGVSGLKRLPLKEIVFRFLFLSLSDACYATQFRPIQKLSRQAFLKFSLHLFGSWAAPTFAGSLHCFLRSLWWIRWRGKKGGGSYCRESEVKWKGKVNALHYEVLCMLLLCLCFMLTPEDKNQGVGITRRHLKAINSHPCQFLRVKAATAFSAT